MSTYRERREAKADRLREWADKRDDKGRTALDRAHELADMIPLGQPILAGHHSEGRHRRDLARIDSGTRQGLEHLRKAEDFRRRADGIEGQLDRSIYSDDDDAIDKLRERIAALEVERDRIKRYNATARKGSPDLSILTDRERADLANLARVAAWQLGKGGSFPAYKLGNLSGNIARNRKRLAELEGGQR